MVGSFSAGMMWSSMLPDNLAKNLPQLSDDQRAELFDSIINVLGYPREDPVREGVIAGTPDTSLLGLFLTLFLFNDRFSLRVYDENDGHCRDRHRCRSRSSCTLPAGLVFGRHAKCC